LSAGVFVLLLLSVRPLRTNCWIVGTDLLSVVGLVLESGPRLRGSDVGRLRPGAGACCLFRGWTSGLDGHRATWGIQLSVRVTGRRLRERRPAGGPVGTRTRRINRPGTLNLFCLSGTRSTQKRPGNTSSGPTVHANSRCGVLQSRGVTGVTAQGNDGPQGGPSRRSRRGSRQNSGSSTHQI
jgi:hypothetical protein